jgi:hypothetical protein
MRKALATTLGIFISPAVPAVLSALLTPGSHDFELSALLGTFPLLYVFSMMFMAIFGVPLICIGISWNLVRWWSAAIAGACVGAVIGFVLGRQHAMNVIFQSALGTLAGLTFWLIWRTGRDECAEVESASHTET